jgi:hypothetical protein
MAERHRELEELLHDGVIAYDAGEIARARDLLTKAVEGGNDTAHLFLDRLSRVQQAPPVSHSPSAATPRAATRSADGAVVERRTGWIAASISAIAVATLMLVGGLPIGSWLYDLQGGSPAPAAPAPPAEPLPVVRASETILTRARALYAGGRLKDALRTLDRIDIADPARPEADRLRADIQRDLLATVGPKPAPTGSAGLRP